MKLLFDITHPVNVHFFKHLIWQFSEAGHDVLVTARAKDVALDLLKTLNIPHVCISRRRSGLLGMGVELLARDMRLAKLVRKFRPDVMVAAEGGVSVAPVGALLGIPTVIFDQVDQAKLQQLLGLPLATRICTSTSFLKDYGPRHSRFRGVLAQAYLDPRRFKPDPGPIIASGLNGDRPLIILRLVSWLASHDMGRKGMSPDELSTAIRRLERFGQVWVSSENALPPGLAQYACPVPVAHLHSLLSMASLCLAEGGTVSVEAGLLGVPAICYNTYDFGYLRAMEKDAGLIRRVATLQAGLELAEEWLNQADIGASWKAKSQRWFQETDDVHTVMADVIQRVVADRRPQRTEGL